MTARQDNAATVKVIRYADADQLVTATADRLIMVLTQIQGEGRIPQVCLTGGRIATALYERVAELGPTSGVDWSRVELWWGDERYVAADSDERNDRAALNAFAGLGLDDALVHQMPAAPDGPGEAAELAAAAESYARSLAGAQPFDVCLLGVGPDGHIASIFPHTDRVDSDVFAVLDSPKPPPQRISLSLHVLNASAQVWLIVSGADKAPAVARALTQVPADAPDPLPAAQVRARELTLWLLDEAAASEVPSA